LCRRFAILSFYLA